MKQKRIITFITIITFALVGYFFYIISFRNDLSDFPPHINAAKTIFEGRGVYSITPNRIFRLSYLLFHVCTKAISFFLFGNYELAATVVLMLMVGVVLYLSIVYYRKFVAEIKLIDYLILLGMQFIVGLPLTGFLYLPQGSPSIWHNPTYIMQKPFSMILFFSFVSIFSDGANQKADKKNYLLFSLFSLLSCYAKPTYVIVFLPFAGIYTLYDMIRKKFKNTLSVLKLSLATTPTLAMLAYQFYTTMEAGSMIGIRFGTFLNLNMEECILATTSVLLLPLLYLIIYRKKITNHIMMILAWGTYAVGWLQYFCLYEVGFAHGNYLWGYSMSIYILYLCTFYELSNQKNDRKKRVFIFLYFIQIVFGIVYFISQLLLKGYMI